VYGLQLLVTNSPFSEQQLQHLNALLPTLTGSQIQWLSGYLAFYQAGIAVDQLPGGVNVSSTQVVEESAAAPAVIEVISSIPKEATILFGSQTGNSQRLAGRLSEGLKALHFDVTLSAMNKFKTNGLKKIPYLFVIVSTHGEGDPPDNAVSLHEFIYGKRAPKLEETKYAVLALGDTSYEFFCKTGQDFDQQLQSLGAERIVDRVDCDVDYEEAASGWIEAVLQKVQLAEGTVPVETTVSAVTSANPSGAIIYTRNHPFEAEVLESINLNGRGSDRETRHLEISLEGSNIHYKPGDAVGIIPQNDPKLVEQLLTTLDWVSTSQVTTKEGLAITIHEALLKQYEITVLSKPLLEKFIPYTTTDKLKQLTTSESKVIQEYVKGRDVLDLIRDYGPWTLQPGDLATILRKIPARLYSIASSEQAHPEEVHVTIRKVQYEAHDRHRNGVCSVYSSERLNIGDKLSIFVQENPNFKLPVNDDIPIIMIGPGTGVAPFRSFLEEREEAGAGGKSWLFYGDRHFVTDFLYQTDWLRMHADGVLNHLDVAFSRDTAEKVYVQHRLLEHATELYTWLEEGAHIYVCGDEKHMAHDVHNALIQIIKEQRNVDEEQAKVYITQLQDDGRYQRDVY